MISFAFIGLLAGLLIGGRFKVLALIPIELAALLVAGACTAVGLGSIGGNALSFVAFSVCIQVGYAVMLVAGVHSHPALRTSRSQA